MLKKKALHGLKISHLSGYATERKAKIYGPCTLHYVTPFFAECSFALLFASVADWLIFVFAFYS